MEIENGMHQHLHTNLHSVVLVLLVPVLICTTLRCFGRNGLSLEYREEAEVQESVSQVPAVQGGGSGTGKHTL